MHGAVFRSAALERLLRGDTAYELNDLRDFAELRHRAVEELRDEGILRDPSVVRAMAKVPREEFLPEDMRPHAYTDTPIPIGYGQTTSALHMTALFCEYGQMRAGQMVLEVGGGCGYMSCVYAEVVAPLGTDRNTWGHVWSAELIPELAELGKENVERLGYSDRVTFLQADASAGVQGDMKFDLIIVTSAAPEIPEELVNQLQTGGTLVIPVGGPSLYQQLIRVRKKSDQSVIKENLGGVAFVPLKGKRGWRN